MPELSVVIPAYNEEERLPPTLASVHAFLTERGRSFEIIIVDDGSIDHTNDVVLDFGKHHDNVRLIQYAPNQGKGFAVRKGVLAARGDCILIDDADGSSPIAEVERLERAITDGADIAIGSRNMPDETVKIEALAYRKHIGNTFNFIVQSLVLPGIHDTQCGFKLFKREVGHDLFSVAQQDRFAFDVEVLFIARLRNYKISEQAINWKNVEGSKVDVIKDSLNMLIEVVKMSVSAAFGRYRRLQSAPSRQLARQDSAQSE